MGVVSFPGYNSDMDIPKKPHGPIGWLVILFCRDPVKFGFWVVALPMAVSGFLRLLLRAWGFTVP